MTIQDEINHELDMLMKTLDEWAELCLDCDHAYKRKSDADMLYCRLRKRECLKKKVKARAERKEE